jgi:hypothetical protein
MLRSLRYVLGRDDSFVGFWGRESGERAGARTQDQRLKRAMLYQLSYPLVLNLRLPRWAEDHTPARPVRVRH